MTTPTSPALALAMAAHAAPAPTRMTTMPTLSEVVNVPFEQVNIIELDQDIGDGLSSLAFLFAKSDEGQTGAQILMSSLPDQGFSVIATMHAFGLYGMLTAPYPINAFHYDKDHGLYVGGATDDTAFGPISDADLFRQTPVRFVCIDDEIFGFGGATPIGSSDYHLTKVVRGLFNTPIQAHAAGTPVMGGLTAGCTYALAGTGTFYFKVVPMNYLGNPMDGTDIEPIKMVIHDKSRNPLRPARLQAIRTGSTLSLSWIPRVRGYGGAGNLSPEISVDLDPPYFTGHFAYSVNDAPKRLHFEPYMDASAAGAATVKVWQRDNGMESDPIVLDVPAEDGTYFTN